MTRLRFRFLVPTLLALTVVVMAAPFQAWVMLGERTVTDRADHDTIAVTGSRGNFRSIKLTVRERAVDFHKVVVHFANGSNFPVELRETIPAGGESRVIDLPGDRRTIKSVEFWYDAKSAGRQALVRLFGKH